jgi:hypothetical protein
MKRLLLLVAAAATLAFFCGAASALTDPSVLPKEPVSVSVGTMDLSDPFDVALAKVGLTKDTMKFDPHDMSYFGGDKYRLAFFDTWMADPFKIPVQTEVIANSLVKLGATGVFPAITGAEGRLNTAIRLGLVGDPLADYVKKAKGPSPLADSIVYLYKKCDRHLPDSERERLYVKAGDVPHHIQELVALFIYTSVDSLDYRRRALQTSSILLAPGTAEYAKFDKLFDSLIKYVTTLDQDVTLTDLNDTVETYEDSVDKLYLNTAGNYVALATDKVMNGLIDLRDKQKFNFNQKFGFEFETPLGCVVLNGGTPGHTYPAGRPYLIILDTAGHAMFNAGAETSGINNPVSVLINMGGNSTYENASPTEGHFGCGILGYGYLVDMAGNSKFVSKSLTQGCGFYGIGALLNLGGNNVYDAFTGAQGAGFFGVGTLVNAKGGNTYHVYQQGQGYGYVRGCGILLDIEGNDTYVAEDKDIKFPAAQSKEHNSSLAQGFGFGKRADYTDGHSLAGGVGILVNGGDDNKFSCGIFGQGAGYWYGTGILAALGKHNEYDGVWYVQASAAHFAIGSLYQAGGGNHFKATMNMAQGAGHDFSIGFLVNKGGDTVYDAPNLSLGGGNANGIGILWDQASGNTYNVTAGTTLGKANIGARGGLRDYMLCLGLFLNTGGGRDTYPADKKFALDNHLWLQPGDDKTAPLAMEKGVGLDW